MSIGPLDIAIILIYLVSTLGLGLFISKNEGIEGYFVNNRKTGLLFLVFTTLSTSVGAGTVFGVIATGYSSGISFGVLFMFASLLGWFLMGYLAPRIKSFGDKTGAYTFGDYLAHQYSSQVRNIGRVVIIVAYFFALGIQFVAFSELIHVVTNLHFSIGLLIAAGITIAYTALAGVKGDFYTDAIQFFVMFPVFIVLLIKGFHLVGVRELFVLPEGFLNLYNYDGPLFFWAGILFGFPLILVSVEAWQRVFAAKSEQTAKRAFYLSGFLKVAVIVVACTIGLLAFHIIPGVDPDGAMFALMGEVLPQGLLGLGLASILAIIMSTVDTGIIVGSVTITKDFYLPRNPQATEKQILRVGRIASLIFGLGGLALAYIFQDIIVLAVVSVQVLLVFAPALLGGLLFHIKNSSAAFWSILLGFAVVIVVLPFDMNLAFVPGTIVSVFVYCGVVFFGKWKNRTIDS